ncbi:MAG: acyl carrier protein [Rhizonema sp. NSF051]|nr:acyl carrier protein [Rhizonema sp. NSF051]
MTNFFDSQLANISNRVEAKNAYIVEAKFEKPKTTADIQAWIVSYLTKELEINPHDIDVTIPFDCYNLDSASAFGMSGALEEWLEHEFDPSLLYDYPTIEALTKYLAYSLSIK